MKKPPKKSGPQKSGPKKSGPKKSAPQTQNPTRVYPDFVDPAADWALGPGIDYFFLPWRKNKDWLPIVILLEGITPKDFLAGTFLPGAERPELSDVFQFSELGPEEEAALHGEGAYYMASAHKNFFFEVLADRSYQEALSKHVKDVTIGLPLDAISLPPSLGGPKR